MSILNSFDEKQTRREALKVALCFTNIRSTRYAPVAGPGSFKVVWSVASATFPYTACNLKLCGRAPLPGWGVLADSRFNTASFVISTPPGQDVEESIGPQFSQIIHLLIVLSLQPVLLDLRNLLFQLSPPGVARAVCSWTRSDDETPVAKMKDETTTLDVSHDEPPWDRWRFRWDRRLCSR